MQARQIVVIGASAGGIDALRALVAGLPPEFPAPICVVLHVSPESPSLLHEILTRAGSVQAVNASNGEPLRPSRIYVAPPDHHLLVEPGIVRVTKGPRENRFRPAIDPLFRSAAQVFGPGAIGVVLTGNLDDGTAGLWAIKQLGGTAIVQDPHEAMYPSMPMSALRHVSVDHRVRLLEIPPLLAELTRAPIEKALPSLPEVTHRMDIEIKVAKEQKGLEAGIQGIGEPSQFACPECHGVLFEWKEANRFRFRCHTGHAYSAESLVAAINEGIEETLWSAVRALEEGDLLLSKLAEHVREAHAQDATRLDERAREANSQAEAIHRLLISRNILTAESQLDPSVGEQKR